MPDTLDRRPAVDPAAMTDDVPAVVKPLLRGWSHAVSFVVVGILGLLLLALTSASRGGQLLLVVYLLGLLAMFGVSAMLPPRPLVAAVCWRCWRKLDHSTIFLAIAGAYTPVAVAALDGWRQTAVLVIVWVGAAFGIALQWVPVHVPRAAVHRGVRHRRLVDLASRSRSCTPGSASLGFALVLAGGLAYTAGAVVYALKRPDPWPTVFGYHEVFHLFTIVGAGCTSRRSRSSSARCCEPVDVRLTTPRVVLRRFTGRRRRPARRVGQRPGRDALHQRRAARCPREEIVDESLPAFLGYYERGDVYGFWAAHRALDRCASSAGSTSAPARATVRASPSSATACTPAAWGHGYATEVSQALIDDGFATHGVERVRAETMVVNAASRRVMEKVGMRLVRTFHADWPVRIDGDEHGDVEYAITRAGVDAPPTA